MQSWVTPYFPLNIKGCIYQAISVYTFTDRYYISLPIYYTKVLNFDTIYSSSSIACIFQTVRCDPIHVSNYLFIATRMIKLKLVKSRIIYRYTCMSFLPLWGCRCWWAVRPRGRCFYSWCFCLESPSSRWPPRPTGSARARTSGDWRKRERINALNHRNRQQEQQIWGERGLRRARTTKWNRTVVCEGAVTAAAYFLWPISQGKVNFVAFFVVLYRSVWIKQKQTGILLVCLFNRVTTAGQRLWWIPRSVTCTTFSSLRSSSLPFISVIIASA